MCGRYVISDVVAAMDYLKIKAPDAIKDYHNFNAAPTQELPIIIESQVKRGRWGLIPAWSDDKNMAYKMINARIETLDQKVTWKQVLKNRCIIPATGFYEWEHVDGAKIPNYITLANNHPMLFAGLFNVRTDKESGQKYITYTIITTSSTGKMKKLHDRTPLILDKKEAKTWLQDNQIPPEEFVKYNQTKIDFFRVSQEVNSIKNNKPELILPQK